MKLLKVIFLVLGILFTVAGISTAIDSLKQAADAATLMGYLIGSFLPCMACFVLAWVFHKWQRRREAARERKELLESLPQ